MAEPTGASPLDEKFQRVQRDVEVQPFLKQPHDRLHFCQGCALLGGVRGRLDEHALADGDALGVEDGDPVSGKIAAGKGGPIVGGAVLARDRQA